MVFQGNALWFARHWHKFFVLLIDQCRNESGGQLQCVGGQRLRQFDEFHRHVNGGGFANHHRAAEKSYEQRGHHGDFLGRRLQLVAVELSMAKGRNKSRQCRADFRCDGQYVNYHKRFG